MSQMLLEWGCVPVFSKWMSVTREIYILHTIQPPGVVLLCSDGMVMPQSSENGKVPAHEVCCCARVQLSICGRT